MIYGGGAGWGLKHSMGASGTEMVIFPSLNFQLNDLGCGTFLEVGMGWGNDTYSPSLSYATEGAVVSVAANVQFSLSV